MKNIDLGLTGFDFTTEILCWYLWGQSEAPKPTELRSGEWIDRPEPILLTYFMGSIKIIKSLMIVKN